MTVLNGQADAGANHFQMAEANAIRAIQEKTGFLRIGNDEQGAGPQQIGTALDGHLPRRIPRYIAGIQVADHNRFRQGIVAGIHVNHVARFQIVVGQDVRDLTPGRGRRKACVAGGPGRAAIEIAFLGFIVYVIIDRIIMDGEVAFADRLHSGLLFILHAP